MRETSPSDILQKFIPKSLEKFKLSTAAVKVTSGRLQTEYGPLTRNSIKKENPNPNHHVQEGDLCTVSPPNQLHEIGIE